MKDIRWIQRFNNYDKALSQLTRFTERTDLNEMEQQGLIQAFEYTFELAWKTLQDFLEETAGYLDIRGPRPVIMKAFQDGYISDGEKWMEMLNDRNRTTHTYNEEIAREIATAIRLNYITLFSELHLNLQKIAKEKSN